MICPIDAKGFCSRHNRRHIGHLKDIALDPSEAGEAYRKAWDGNSGAALPSTTTKARNYISTLSQHVLNNFAEVPAEIREQRQDICNGCDKRDPAKNACKVCGCKLEKTFLGDKLAWAVSKCPLGKWEAYHEKAPASGGISGAVDASISWPITIPDWPTDGNWIKAPDVWDKFRVLLSDAMDYHKTLQPLHGEGNGIVIVGGGKYFASSYCNIRLLRHHGCNLPIELWYLGSKNEMPEKWQKIVEPYGVTCRDGDAERDVCPMRILNGWELKFYAIQQSCFRRVLFLDADCFPMREPSFVFDDPRFLGTGAVFQRDTINGSFQFIKPEVLKMFGIQRESKIWDIESGACLIDRARWSNALRLTVFLNGYSDLIYKVVYGDKTTPAIASMLTGMTYAIPAYAPIGGAWGLMQKWFDGSKMWQHRIHCKPRLDTQAYHSSQLRKLFPKIAWDAEIMQYLEDLRRVV